MNDKIKVIVFDLDGTIYQNITFHKDYIHYLVEGTDKEAWEENLLEFVDDVFCGKRLKMNMFYHAIEIEAADPDHHFSMLEEAIAADMSCDDMPAKDEYIYLGDAWAVLTLLGYSLGLNKGDRCEEIYKRTRQSMEIQGLHGNERLRNAIVKAGMRYEIVLLSNSYFSTAMEFLRQIGFDQIFGKMEFSVEKPHGLVNVLKKLCPLALDHPETVLTIGDHAYNDLEILRRIGCCTLWINPFTGIHEPSYDFCVKTLDELADYLDALCG